VAVALLGALSEADAVAQAKKRVDLYGDPLPDGAALRLGTIRLRANGTLLALSPDGRTLIGVRAGKYVSNWDVETGKLKETRELPTLDPLRPVLSPDGRWLVTYHLEICDVEAGKVLHKLPLQGSFSFAPARAFSPDGKQLATVGVAKGQHPRPHLGSADGQGGVCQGRSQRRRAGVRDLHPGLQTPACVLQ